MTLFISTLLHEGSWASQRVEEPPRCEAVCPSPAQPRCSTELELEPGLPCGFKPVLFFHLGVLRASGATISSFTISWSREPFLATGSIRLSGWKVLGGAGSPW